MSESVLYQSGSYRKTPLRSGAVGGGESTPMMRGSTPAHYGVHTQPAKLQQVEPKKERTCGEMAAPFVCEFMGTFMLTFIIATCNFSWYKQWLPNATGCALIVIIYAVGFVSGGHLNPAVSLSFLLTRKMNACKCLCYMFLQFCAAILAGLFFELVFLRTASGVTPVAPFHFREAAIIELLFTTMLCFVFLNVTASVRNNPDHDKNQFFALAIGSAAIAAGYAGGFISGAAINPAVAVGLDVPSGYVNWGLLYALMELLGGVLAAILFRICRGEDYQPYRLTQGGLGPADDLSLYVPTLSVRMFSEFVGTFFIVMTFGICVIMVCSATAWAVGVALLCMVYALGNVSGGHFNPAVTFAVCLSGRNKCSRQEVCWYWLAQLLGGAAAGILVRHMHYFGPTRTLNFPLGGIENYGGSNYYWGTVMTVEILFTFLLTYSVLTVATCDEYSTSSSRSRQNFYFALAIGFTMSVGVFAASPISGGYLNPAAAFAFAIESMPSFDAAAHVQGWPGWSRWFLQGIAVICKVVGFFSHWLWYFFIELIGACLAAMMFRCTHPAEYLPKAPVLVSYVQYPTPGAQYS